MGALKVCAVGGGSQVVEWIASVPHADLGNRWRSVSGTPSDLSRDHARFGIDGESFDRKCRMEKARLQRWSLLANACD